MNNDQIKELSAKITTVPEMYRILSRIYSCKHADNLQEIEAAHAELHHALITEQSITKEQMVLKMVKLKRVTDSFQSKLATQIINRFWEKSFDSSVELRRYVPEDEY